MDEKKKLVKEVDQVIDFYCEDCFLYKYHRKEYGRNFAHRFCITKCTVGEKIQNIGKNFT
ncbi:MULTISPECIES: zinc-finger domain-containing protein [Cytobacillus]|uniref:Zinc-finger domain-containing protein n=1 Tax=Cytobacillus stercorigallinarum TaxID=2762240 RepID=A0ABR8QKU2_9BACI|nr:zinc-finger domain-containing protein [Cytobacillus stercorigallinarum]MBD7936145.1 zinc-finger domain-containing protein [Cytobacillus stercorigallinarum]